MYYLLKSIKNHYNVYSDTHLDTTGEYCSIEDCFVYWNRLKDNRQVSLNYVLSGNNYTKNSILCAFETSDFHEFKSQFPELFI